MTMSMTMFKYNTMFFSFRLSFQKELRILTIVGLFFAREPIVYLQEFGCL